MKNEQGNKAQARAQTRPAILYQRTPLPNARNQKKLELGKARTRRDAVAGQDLEWSSRDLRVVPSGPENLHGMLCQRIMLENCLHVFA